jgi:hypothetical protein
VDEFHLEVGAQDGNAYDKNFLKFQASVFNQLLDHYGILADDPAHVWTPRDLFYAAQLLLKAKDVYTFWKHDTGGSGHPAVEFIFRVCALLVKAKLSM